MNPKYFSQGEEGQKGGMVHRKRTPELGCPQQVITLVLLSDLKTTFKKEFGENCSSGRHIYTCVYLTKEWNRVDTYTSQEQYLRLHTGMLVTPCTTAGQYLVLRQDGATICSFCSYQRSGERRAQRGRMNGDMSSMSYYYIFIFFIHFYVKLG